MRRMKLADSTWVYLFVCVYDGAAAFNSEARASHRGRLNLPGLSLFVPLQGKSVQIQ